MLFSSHGLMPSLANFFEISRTAGLSSLLWHRNTSKISALESCPFTQRQFYGETCWKTNQLRRFRASTSSHSVIPTSNKNGLRPTIMQSVCPIHCIFTSTSIMDALNAGGIGAECGNEDFSEKPGLMGTSSENNPGRCMVIVLQPNHCYRKRLHQANRAFERR